MAKSRLKYFIFFKFGVPPTEMALRHQFMLIYLAVFDLVFLQQERPCEDEIHWIMFYYY